MTQLLLSSLAAGSKGFGFWCWSARSAGKEAGESSLLDRHNQVTPRAIRAGQIGLAAQKYRDELWQAHKEPVVGVCLDWENDALWAAISADGHDALRQRPVEARIGVSRALINAGVPFEYVTAADLRAGLGRRYPVLCLPSIVMLPKDILDLLGTFVEQGGRLVMDLPSAWYDEQAGLLSSERGSAFERIFGAVINEFQFAGTNRPEQLAGLDLQGFLVDLTPTHARVVARYAGGKPAVTEAKTGEGTAIILGYEAARACFQPGNGAAESELIQYLLGTITVPFACRGALAYRLAAPEADHFFLINDGPATQATLSTGSLRYARFTDAVTGETLVRARPIAVEANSGRWVRAEKQLQPP
jgi:beta-galactosidase